MPMVRSSLVDNLASYIDSVPNRVVWGGISFETYAVVVLRNLQSIWRSYKEKYIHACHVIKYSLSTKHCT